MERKDYKVEKIKQWTCPEGTGAPLITMPNVPRPLHGLPPRKLMGDTTWNRVRKRCYYDAGYKCEICGEEPPKGQLHAHELYTYDFAEGTGTFERCIAVCKKCHDFIHSGRLVTMFKNGNMLYPKSYLLTVVEKGFKIISEYNAEHRNMRPLKAYVTILDYLKVPELHDDIDALIKKYDILFYSEPNHIAKWEKWRLVWNGREYYTPYKSQTDWEEAMQKASKTDVMRAVKDPFSEGIFGEIKKKLDKSNPLC